MKLRLLWTRLLHHVANNHEYCEHEEIEDRDDWLDPASNPMQALREVVTDPKLLKSFHYYVRNRHTGMLEVIT